MLREDLRNFEFIEKMCPMGKRWVSLGVIVVLLGPLTTASGQMQVERIDRGAVAVVKEGGCFLSWRLLGDEPYDLGSNGGEYTPGDASTGDLNGDGKHDIVTGSAVIASDGTGMHTSGMGHGDATHVTYMLKDFDYPQIFMPHESGGHGFSLRHAHNGELLFNHRNPNDVGRGVGAEIDPEVPGFHFWGTHGMGLFNMAGERVGRGPRSMNFVVWWDGDLSRELLSGRRIEKWSIANNSSTVLLDAQGANSINGTKATPVLQADLLGDWREEVILRRDDNEALRVYTTTMPTAHRLYTLMHDPVYRVAISWQNSSYNQPPHPGYYLAGDMDFPPPTPVIYMPE